ncbi:Bromo adjacent-like domain protein [Quillaja saponaria]|uniref:Bromo adjacent-like domain protein n=1 Tax=Quillaja saponaria TaxID=32244 RepID=A0AAD7KNN5_QUISA|nr:Bromo adjacent-like domain protein [Quillaja saponaria]
MERLTSPSSEYVSWEEKFVVSDKGRKEVHFFLKRRDGSSDLAVIGKEKSLRHLSYHYAIQIQALVSMRTSSMPLKLKSRSEVIDWLNSIVSDSFHGDFSNVTCAFMDCKDACEIDIETLKGNQLKKLGHHTKEFSWLGSSWVCKKRRRHYQSFRRNSVKISVYDFVYVLAEEDKRLVAYLEDMYEDSRGNKMVVVRWFHKIDEVGIVLPRNFNDREIFFSLCLQDLNIECIDGLATVLSPQHFKKFQNEARHTLLETFVCEKQFENDDVKPYDITQIKGYWKQEILRYMYTLSYSKSQESSQQSDDGLKEEENFCYTVRTRPRKRHRLSKVDGKYPIDIAGVEFQNLGEICDSFTKHEASTTPVATKETNENHLQCIVGSQVEVLSQDSGIRGCWFRASVIKKHKNKVKVRYQDIQDAADEANKLEEWILASRVAAPDHLSLRMCGRTTVRPAPKSNKSKMTEFVDTGAVVDAWWHDGWWEGIVVRKEIEDKFHVYFPGEKQLSVFGFGELRHSQEWTGTKWELMKERPDIVSSILGDLDPKQVPCRSVNAKSAQASVCDSVQSKPCKRGCSGSPVYSENDKLKDFVVVPDLSKDDLLAQLRWKSSRKRRRGSGSGSTLQKLPYNTNVKKSSPNIGESHTSGRFMVPASLKVDHDDCKYIGGDSSIFSSNVVPSLTNMVMCM